MAKIQISVAQAEIWLKDDLEKVYALLFGFVGNGFQLALCNVGWLTTRKFVILVDRSHRLRAVVGAARLHGKLCNCHLIPRHTFAITHRAGDGAPTNQL